MNLGSVEEIYVQGDLTRPGYVYVRIPIRIVSSPNMREHWTAKYKREKRQKWACIAMLQGHKTFPPCTVVFTREGPKECDYDNLLASLKHIRDCVSDKILPGLAPGRADGDTRITWEYKQRKSKTYALVIEINPG